MIRNITKLTCKNYGPVLSIRLLSTSSALYHESTASKNQESTANTEEVLNFTKLANNWWDEDGQLKALHSMNTLRIPFIRDGLKNRKVLHPDFVNSSTPLKYLNIIDVGCGGGILCEPLARLGANVTGVDACEDLIKGAKAHADNNIELKNKINYIYGTLEGLVANNKNKFDAVVTSECLEHVISKETFLKSCAEVLKPGGSLFLTTLNKTTLSWIFGIVAAEYIFNIVPKGTHDWKKFVQPHEVQKILENNNCQTRTIHGMAYNMVFNQWCWISNTSVNYALHAIKNN